MPVFSRRVIQAPASRPLRLRASRQRSLVSSQKTRQHDRSKLAPHSLRPLTQTSLSVSAAVVPWTAQRESTSCSVAVEKWKTIKAAAQPADHSSHQLAARQLPARVVKRSLLHLSVTHKQERNWPAVTPTQPSEWRSWTHA